MRFWTGQLLGMAKTKAQISRNRDFLGVAPLQTDRHTHREKNGLAAPRPAQEICIPWAGSRLPTPMNFYTLRQNVCISVSLFSARDNLLDHVAAGAGKNGTSSFSASAFAWAVPGTGLALWAPQALGRGYPLFGPKSGSKFRNAQNCFLDSQNALQR